jgi:hypothetical protein
VAGGLLVLLCGLAPNGRQSTAVEHAGSLRQGPWRTNSIDAVRMRLVLWDVGLPAVNIFLAEIC